MNVTQVGEIYNCDCGFSWRSGKNGSHECGYGLRKQLADIKAERDALAAENAALRKAHPQPFGPIMMQALDAYQAKEDEIPEQGMMDAFFILRDSITVTSQQTEVYLNSVRAEGIEILTGKLQQLIDEGTFDAKEIGVAAGAVHEGAQIAAQLRAGKDGE